MRRGSAPCQDLAWQARRAKTFERNRWNGFGMFHASLRYIFLSKNAFDTLPTYDGKSARVFSSNGCRFNGFSAPTLRNGQNTNKLSPEWNCGRGLFYRRRATVCVFCVLEHVTHTYDFSKSRVVTLVYQICAQKGSCSLVDFSRPFAVCDVLEYCT